MSEPVLKVSGLAKRFAIRSRGQRRMLTAVDGVDLQVHARETVALIGESGSGSRPWLGASPSVEPPRAR